MLRIQRTLNTNFNSIKVRLKPSAYADASDPLCDFNSIKVRLKHPVQQNAVNANEFQFHKGTIKTFGADTQSVLNNTFQFHKGTIKTIIL